MPKWRVPRKENGKIDFTPRRHHGFSFVIMLCGFLLPPLAVAVRFGIGRDFFINCICTICGYFPGHGHNFFIQNIRNNEHRNRTPKWARRYGLVDDTDQRRLQKKRAWVGRYNDENASRQMYDDEGNVYTYDRNHRFEDGDNPSRPRHKPATSSEDGLDRFYGQSNGAHRREGDEQSLRRTKSRSSIRSLGRRSTHEQDILPGSAEADRRRNKNMSKVLPMLTGAGRKNKADRHVRAERVMHDSDYINNNRPDHDAESYEIDNLGRRDSFEGPENADDTVGKQYNRVNGYAHVSNTFANPVRKATNVDVMDDHHQF